MAKTATKKKQAPQDDLFAAPARKAPARGKSAREKPPAKAARGASAELRLQR